MLGVAGAQGGPGVWSEPVSSVLCVWQCRVWPGPEDE